MPKSTLVRKIGTHDGSFHADEVFGCAALKICYPKAQIIRSREPQVLEDCDIVLDVGSVYDHLTHRYDHHQRGGAGERANNVPYASAGLVWKHFGDRVCRKVLRGKRKVSINALVSRVDLAFIQGIDALDSGVTSGGFYLEGHSQEKLSLLTVSKMIELFCPVGLVEERTADILDSEFFKLLPWAQKILKRVVAQETGKVASHDIIYSAKNDSPILVLPVDCDWEETVCNELPHIRVIVYPIINGSWRVKVAPKQPGSFESRFLLPETWAGLNDKALQDISGVKDGIFVHAKRFVGGASTKEGAIKLAETALRIA